MATMKHWESVAEGMASAICNKEIVDELDLLKVNILRLAADHRDHCSMGCAISLYQLRQAAERAGMKFSADEQRLFL